MENSKTTVSLLSVMVGILLIDAPSMAQSPSGNSLTNGLVAYYPFTGNANDQTLTANNGTPNNAVLATDRFNRAGSAYAFNGANAYVSAPNKSYLSFPSGEDFSVCVWAAANGDPSASSYQQWFICGLDNGPGATPKWILSFGQLNFPNPPQGNHLWFNTVVGSQVFFLATTPHAPVLGSWHQYIATKTGTNYTIYIDGLSSSAATNYEVVSGSTTVMSNIGGPPAIPSGITAPLTIGWAEGGGHFNGKLDDVRIYNRALSPLEVAQLYLVESGPRVDLIKAVRPSFSNLILGKSYQLQISADVITWSNQGSPFTATQATMVYPQSWDVDNWSALHFRLQTGP